MSNIWKSFQNLIDKDATYIATISSTDGEHSTVELLSGDMLRVLGTGTVGAKVYIKGGQIIQSAGELTQYNLILF